MNIVKYQYKILKLKEGVLMFKIHKILFERRFNYICIDMYYEIFSLVKWGIDDSSKIQEVIDAIFSSVLDAVRSNQCVRKNYKQIVYGIALREIRKKNSSLKLACK